MSAILKHEILNTLQDCMGILSRNEQEDRYYMEQTLAHMETAYKLIEASKMFFKPIMIDEITIH